MSWTESAGAARALFPSLGYFGSLNSDCLIVPVWQRVRYLKLSIEDDAPSVLSLRGVQMFHDGKPIRLAPSEVRVRQSSVYESNAGWGPEALLTFRGNHTDWESNPWWDISLSTPIQVNRLCVFNRSDAWGHRAFSIRVEIESASGAHRVLYRGSSADALVSQLAKVLAIAGSIEAVPGDDVEAASRMRLVLLDRVASRIRAGGLAPSEAAWSTLVSLISIGEHTPLSADETTLLAAAILGATTDTSTPSLRLFEGCLESKDARDALDSDLASLADLYGIERVPFSDVDGGRAPTTR